MAPSSWDECYEFYEATLWHVFRLCGQSQDMYLMLLNGPFTSTTLHRIFALMGYTHSSSHFNGNSMEAASVGVFF